MGTPNEEAGAWIRFNPLTGAGVRNCDVADFRYALVESDDMPIEAQAAMIAELQLPCAAIVHSGCKSLHAIVKMDAKDASQYRERVETLYRELKRNGFVPDEQNKNPSRLSRFPGFMRSGAPAVHREQGVRQGELGGMARMGGRAVRRPARRGNPFRHLFYSCASLASVSGLGNLAGVRSMRFMFASSAVTELDFRGFDPSALTDLYYAFSSCSKLTTIYAGATWALPASGIS